MCCGRQLSGQVLARALGCTLSRSEWCMERGSHLGPRSPESGAGGALVVVHLPPSVCGVSLHSLVFASSTIKLLLLPKYKHNL